MTARWVEADHYSLAAASAMKFEAVGVDDNLTTTRAEREDSPGLTRNRIAYR